MTDGRRRALPGLLLAASMLAAPAWAHEGDAEDRAVTMLGLLQQLDRHWGLVMKESDPARRAERLAVHARTLLAAQDALVHAADQSPCVMLEAQDHGRQLACLVDVEARQRAAERILGHLLQRQALTPP